MNTCFLADDDDEDQELFHLALEEAAPDMKCFTARDGQEALNALRNPDFTPGYIFLDLNMPRMDGKECLKELLKLSHLRDTPIIIFSTSSAEKDIEHTKQLGAAAFITKPPLVSILVSKLQEVFNTFNQS
jgi:CheY-like chemotaxis protein